MNEFRTLRIRGTLDDRVLSGIADQLAAWRAEPRPIAAISLCHALAEAGGPRVPSDEPVSPRPAQPAGYLDVVLEVGREAGTRFGDDAEVLLAIGRMYLSAGGLVPEAQSIVVRAARLVPTDPRAFRLLGETLLRRGDAVRAVKAFERAILGGMKDPHTRAWHRRSRVYEMVQQRRGEAGVIEELERDLGESGAAAAAPVPAAAAPVAARVFEPRPRSSTLLGGLDVPARPAQATEPDATDAVMQRSDLVPSEDDEMTRVAPAKARPMTDEDVVSSATLVRPPPVRMGTEPMLVVPPPIPNLSGSDDDQATQITSMASIIAALEAAGVPPRAGPAPQPPAPPPPSASRDSDPTMLHGQALEQHEPDELETRVLNRPNLPPMALERPSPGVNLAGRVQSPDLRAPPAPRVVIADPESQTNVWHGSVAQPLPEPPRGSAEAELADDDSEAPTAQITAAVAAAGARAMARAAAQPQPPPPPAQPPPPPSSRRPPLPPPSSRRAPPLPPRAQRAQRATDEVDVNLGEPRPELPALTADSDMVSEEQLRVRETRRDAAPLRGTVMRREASDSAAPGAPMKPSELYEEFTKSEFRFPVPPEPASDSEELGLRGPSGGAPSSAPPGIGAGAASGYPGAMRPAAGAPGRSVPPSPPLVGGVLPLASPGERPVGVVPAATPPFTGVPRPAALEATPLSFAPPPRKGGRLFKALLVGATIGGGAAGAYWSLEMRAADDPARADELAARAEAAVRAGGPRALASADEALKRARQIAPANRAVALAAVRSRTLRVLEDEPSSVGGLREAIAEGRRVGLGVELGAAEIAAAVVSGDAAAADAAVKLYDRDPGRSSDALYQLASAAALERRGQVAAIARYEAAVAAQPGWAPAEVRLARALLLSGDLERGRARVRNMAADSPQTRVLAALAAALEGTNPAAAAAPTAPADVADLPRPLRSLAWALSVLGRTEARGASSGLAAAIDDADAPAVAVICGQVALAAADVEAAGQARDRARAMAPDAAMTTDFTRQTELVAGELAKAREGGGVARSLALAELGELEAGRSPSPAARPGGAPSAAPSASAAPALKPRQTPSSILRPPPPGASTSPAPRSSASASATASATPAASSSAAPGNAPDTWSSAGRLASLLAGHAPASPFSVEVKKRLTTARSARTLELPWVELLLADAWLDEGNLVAARSVVDRWPDPIKHRLFAPRRARLLRYEGKLADARAALGDARDSRHAWLERALLDGEDARERAKTLAALGEPKEADQRWLVAYLRAKSSDPTGARRVLARSRLPTTGSLPLRVLAAVTLAELGDRRGRAFAEALLVEVPKHRDVLRAAAALGAAPP